MVLIHINKRIYAESRSYAQLVALYPRVSKEVCTDTPVRLTGCFSQFISRRSCPQQANKVMRGCGIVGIGFVFAGHHSWLANSGEGAALQSKMWPLGVTVSSLKLQVLHTWPSMVLLSICLSNAKVWAGWNKAAQSSLWPRRLGSITPKYCRPSSSQHRPPP